MGYELSKTFRFESAHWLPTFPEGHKCRRLHGHSFQAEIVVKGELPDGQAYLIDYGDIKSVVQPVIDTLDHRLLNELGEQPGYEKLQDPTAENIAAWIYESIHPNLPKLYAVIIYETCTSKCSYFGK